MQTLVLTFRTTSNKLYRVSIPEPKDGLTSNEINQAASLLIEKNIFSTKVGDLQSLESARIIDRNVSTIIENA